MNQWLPGLPIWLTEGAAEYMVVPDYMHGRFNFGQIQNHLSSYFEQRIRGREIGILSLCHRELTRWGKVGGGRASSIAHQVLNQRSVPVSLSARWSFPF